MKVRWLTYENGLLLLLAFTFGVAFFDRNAINYLMPFIIDELQLNNFQIGMIGSGMAVAWALAAYLIAAWSDRTGVRKPFLLVTVVVFSLCSVISGLAGVFLVLLMARVIMGMAEGPILPVSLAIMNSESTPGRRGVNAGILQTFFGSLLGSTVAPLLVVFLAELYGWRVTFYLAGVPGLICALLIWKLVREPIVKKERQADYAAPGINPIKMLSVHNVLLCSLISCCMVAWYLLVVIFAPLIFTELRGYSAVEMSRLMAVTGICTVIGGFLLPGISDRIGRKPVMVVFCFVSMLAPLAALYFSGPLWILGMLFFIGWSGSATFPLFMGVIPSESVEPGFIATAMGLVVCFGELTGGALAPVLSGFAADQTSLAAPALIAAGCALVAGILSMFLIETAPARTKGSVEQREAGIREAA
jgi:MFS family permease